MKAILPKKTFLPAGLSLFGAAVCVSASPFTILSDDFTVTISEGTLAEPLSLTVGDPSVIETGFDTFAIHTSRFDSERAFHDSFVFHNFEVVSSVPEPATYSLLLGGGVLLAGFLFRRRLARREAPARPRPSE